MVSRNEESWLSIYDIEAFQQAIDGDPDLAMAYSHLEKLEKTHLTQLQLMYIEHLLNKVYDLGVTRGKDTD